MLFIDLNSRSLAVQDLAISTRMVRNSYDTGSICWVFEILQFQANQAVSIPEQFAMRNDRGRRGLRIVVFVGLRSAER